MHSFRYFRHWLNIVILWSVWSEFELMPYVLVQHLFLLGYPDTVTASKQNNGCLLKACGRQIGLDNKCFWESVLFKFSIYSGISL